MRSIKVTTQLLVIFMMFTLLGCFGSNQELIQEQDSEMVKLRGELEQLSDQLEVEQNLIKQLKQAKLELSEKLDTEQLKKARKQGEVDSLKAVIGGRKLLSNRISIPNSVLFGSGSSDLTGRGKLFIDEVGEILSNYSNREILIEGHSDDVPIGKGYRWKYNSNWELSSARAMVVLHYLEDEHQINPKLLGAVAFVNNDRWWQTVIERQARIAG